MALLGRDEAIQVIEDGQAALGDLFSRLTDDEMSRPKAIGGGDWSAKDLLGHIAFWEELAVDTLVAFRAGRPSSADEIFGDQDVDAGNARDQVRTAADPVDTVRQRASAAHAALVEGIRAASDDEWRARVRRPDGRQARVGERVGAVLGAPKQPFGHAYAHLPDLEAYVRSLGRL